MEREEENHFFSRRVENASKILPLTAQSASIPPSPNITEDVVEIYRFSGEVADYTGDPTSKEAKALLGGKGAGLTMMAQQGLNVPPGFTIQTTLCKTWMALGSEADKTEFMNQLMIEVNDHMSWLEKFFGYAAPVFVRFG